MVHIVGAGSGAPDLITLRGAELLRKAQVVIYAGSLVNPSLLGLCGPDCRLYNSAHLTLEEGLEMAGESISVARIPREALETPITLWDWYRMNTRAGKRE